MRRLHRLIGCVLGLAIALHAGPSLAQSAPKNDVTKAEQYMQKLEKEVDVARGKPFTPRYDGQEALRRVKDLKSRYPNDPAVEALFQRARKALMASKGDTFEITPEMLAYREAEKKLTQTIAGLADEDWAARQAGWKKWGAFVSPVFPAPDPMKTAVDSMLGRVVVLTDFAYPRDEFTDTGGQFVFAGSGTRGYYFVELSGREWKGAYGALKRYQRSVNAELPEGWTVVGQVTGATLLVPQAGEEKTMSPAWGWRVAPIAIYVAGRTLAWPEPALPEGGTFSGEGRLAALKAANYTYTSVPADVEPLKLVEIFATAIKEKNQDLYLDCIDPERKRTPTALALLRYYWDNNLQRYRSLYVYVHPVEVVSQRVVKGESDSATSNEAFFLDDAQRADVAKRAADKVEEASVSIRTFDERGRQVSLPKQVKMRRYKGGRWYISEGYPL